MKSRYEPSEHAIQAATVANQHFDSMKEAESRISEIDSFDSANLPNIIQIAIEEKRSQLASTLASESENFKYSCRIADSHFNDRPVKWRMPVNN